MSPSRLEAFSDGVLAIIITIMVLEMRPPEGVYFSDLRLVWPVFLSYVLSFVYIGIYWMNHHHLLKTVHHVTASVLWANLFLLFWLSLLPFATSWMGEHKFAAGPTALYAVVLLMASIAYYVLQLAITRSEADHSVLRVALGSDYKGKTSIVLYAVALVFAAFRAPIVANLIFWAVAIMWVVPDRRIERALNETHDSSN